MEQQRAGDIQCQRTRCRGDTACLGGKPNCLFGSNRLRMSGPGLLCAVAVSQQTRSRCAGAHREVIARRHAFRAREQAHPVCDLARLVRRPVWRSHCPAADLCRRHSARGRPRPRLAARRTFGRFRHNGAHTGALPEDSPSRGRLALGRSRVWRRHHRVRNLPVVRTLPCHAGVDRGLRQCQRRPAPFAPPDHSRLCTRARVGL